MDKSKQNTILIVDDDKHCLIDLTHILDDEYRLVTAKNGSSAVEKAHEIVPDLILLDVVMQGMDGFDVLFELKKSDKTKNIPVIFITAMGDDDHEMAGLTVGAVDYIRKPFNANIVKLRVRHQVELVNIQRQLIQSEMDAKMTNQAKTMLFANMSHEIKIPLNSIIGFSEIMKYETLQPKAKDYLKRITECSKQLLQTINLVLDISKFDTGKMELENIPFDPIDLLSVCRTAVITESAKKDIDLRMNIDAPEDKILVGDSTKLLQVLVNLLSNAIKFTDSGVVKMLATVTDKFDDKIKIMFEVRDTGIGMSPEQIDIIFDPFLQAESEIIRENGRPGLGLAISKKIVEMMGSTLNVESKPGEGSRFSFEVTFDTMPIGSDYSSDSD